MARTLSRGVSEIQVAQRWLRLCPNRKDALGQAEEPELNEGKETGADHNALMWEFGFSSFSVLSAKYYVKFQGDAIHLK